MKKLLFSIIVLLPTMIWAQPGNYWTNSFNTEASLLSGAVVGGNAGVTAIFYNPAGISDNTESRFDLNASLFNIEQKLYTNPLGEDTKMENMSFKVFPRFTSYIYQSRKHKGLTYQFAVFNRNSAHTVIYNRKVINNIDIVYEGYNENYTGLFDFASEYDDYWGSLGISKVINDRWSLGVSFNLSIQGLAYFRSATANVIPNNYPQRDSLHIYSSNWQSYERIRAYNWRFITKLGVLFRENNLRMGLSITLPSLRLFGNADVNKTVSQSNIFHNNVKVPDYYLSEYPQYVYFQIKEPFSASFGLMYDHKEITSTYFLTVEYFAPIAEYYSIDPSKGETDESILGSDFSAYKLSHRSVLNISIGYKKMLTKTLGFLAGFRTDTNPYKMGYNQKYWESNSYEEINVDIFHLTGGVKFDYKRSSFVVGLQHSFGRKTQAEEFINFSDPVGYDPDTKLALQGKRTNDMTYTYSSLGFYLGFSIEF